MNPRKRRIENGKILLEYDSVSSTQEIARTLYKRGQKAIIAVRADYQRSGHGRFGRNWLAHPGTSLLITYIVPLTNPERAPLIGMAAGLAVARSIEECAGLQAQLKWPNDVMINGRKAAGVLVETCSDRAGARAALTGVGVNLNETDLPAELERSATSTRIEGGRAVDILEFEALLRPALFQYAEQVQKAGFEPIRLEWNIRDAGKGRTYSVSGEYGSAVGRALGISHSGALLMQLEDGTVIDTIHATAA